MALLQDGNRRITQGLAEFAQRSARGELVKLADGRIKELSSADHLAEKVLGRASRARVRFSPCLCPSPSL